MSRLDHAKCALLRDEKLVERYNAVCDVLDRAVGDLPRFGDKEVVKEVRGELAQLAQRMTKQRFEIGFIGPSQAGKSTTVGNLLAVDEKDSPAPQGASGATTSVPTRLVPRPTATTREHVVTLRYFSEEEFRSRVRDLCDLLDVTYETDLRGLRDAVKARHDAEPHFRAADHEVLLKLLDAAIACGDVLHPTAKEETGDYSQRRIYATHRGKDDPPSKYALLREICIEFATDAISPEIEMIDLPGLGVEKGSDDRLTLSFLHHLDGAFMFQHGHLVQAGAVAQLAEKMRGIHSKTLGERVWMVVTRCDDLNSLQLRGPSDEPNPRSMFCHLQEVLRHQGIKGQNVLFVGNAYYQYRLAAGLDESTPPPESLRTRFDAVLQFDAAGQPTVPERCAQYPGQVEPWRQFVLNSGIPALRRTMQTEVADAVREQTRKEVWNRLFSIIDRASAALQAAEQQAGMSVEDMLRAAKWSGELDRLADDVGRDPRYSGNTAAAIADTLGDVIGTWGEPTQGALAKDYQDLSGLLSRVGLEAATDQTAAVAGLVKTRIEERSREQAPPKAAGLPTPLEHWDTVVATFLAPGKTADGTPFREPIFAGIRTDPCPVTAGGQQLSATDYFAVMRAKVGRVSRVYASRLVHEMQRHLRRLQGRYRAVGSDVEGVDAKQREKYASYRNELEQLRQ